MHSPEAKQHRCEFCGAISTDAGGKKNEGKNITISIVIPVFNEADQIAANLGAIRSHARQTTLPTEFVVVDDGSSDETWAELETLRREIPELSALRLSRNFGKEAAICAGLAHARGRACIVIDSDLQHPPALIPEMVNLWKRQKVHIVEAVKKTRGGESLLNKIGARIFYRSLSYLSGYDLDGACDFKLLDRRVLEAWQEMHERTTFFRGMIAWLGYSRRQLFFEVRERNATRSRWSLWSLIRLGLVAITAFSSLPLQAVTILGGLVLLCSFVLGIYVLCFYFSGLAVPGFTTVILLQLMIGGALMISLGIIGTYIARIYEEAKRRPRYIISAAFPSSEGAHFAGRPQGPPTSAGQ
jgi:glycosyltransferase involved in cell wall biosynthesis